MQKRAYSLLTIKSVNEDAREITGIATTPSTDSYGDIVVPEGAEYKLPIPLLWQHDASQPIGEVYAARTTPNGIEIRARIVKMDEPGTLADRLTEAWQSIKSGLVKGLSIGFRALEYSIMNDTGGYKFERWQWLELSSVTIPANSDASITAIRSQDAIVRAALGQPKDKTPANTPPSGASEKKTKPLKIRTAKEAKTMKLSEQIKQFEAERAAKHAALTNLVKEGETLDAAKEEEFETLEAEIDQIDKHLKRLTRLQKMEAETAAPVGDVDTAAKAAAFRAGAPAIHTKRDQDEKFKGQNFTRMTIAKALSHIDENRRSPAVIAEQRWGKTNPTLVALMKANEIDSGGEASGAWGHELVQANGQFTGDFIELLNAATVFDRLGLRDVPANVIIKGQDGAATGYWVGEGKAIPASAQSFSDVTLTPLKVAAITTISNELLRDSSPAAEALVRDALIQATAQKIDTTFLSSTAASAGVSPAGVLHGLSGGTSAGTDGDGVRADIKALYAGFIAAFNASNLTFVMNTALAKSLQLMVNALGQPEFPGITQTGGTLMGDRVVTGDNVGSGDLILLKPSDIYKIGDLGIQVSVSNQATIENSSAPAGAALAHTPASAVLTNTFQQELTAIKVVRPLNFALRRASAVAYIDDADYGSVASS